jgi:hypothetical protein
MNSAVSFGDAAIAASAAFRTAWAETLNRACHILGVYEVKIGSAAELGNDEVRGVHPLHALSRGVTRR